MHPRDLEGVITQMVGGALTGKPAGFCWRTEGESKIRMDERRKRVLGMVLGILMARHLKT
jgi:hypothetical protein